MCEISITGASGFLGKYLLDCLAESGDYSIRVLVRHGKKQKYPTWKNFVITVGDLLKYESLASFIVPGCTVINLAYLEGCSRDDHLKAMDNLIRVSAEVGIKRFIHCSTAVVAGDVADSVINENTACNPVSEYEKIKLELEQTLLKRASGLFETTILRPTAVFGVGGKNLLKLAGDLRTGNKILNYLKTCLFDRRRMNLVAVDNVTAAIKFLVDHDQSLDGEIFFVSDDEVPENNYRDVDSLLKMKWGIKGHVLPVIPLPRVFLSFLLQITGRPNTNPLRIYSSDKLMSRGFKKPVSFTTALTAFTKSYEEPESRV